MAELHVVTGAFGFTGSHIARRLLDRGIAVRTLTGHANRVSPLHDLVDIRRLQFTDERRLVSDLEGARVLYNTYWVRFEHGATTFAGAVQNSRTLLRAAAEAGVERVVHVSITNPSLDSPLPYFRGKAEVEEALRASGLSHAVLRPAVFFGGRDVLVNNIAWLLRRLPAFGLASGAYGLQPVHVEDFARLAVEQGASRADVTLDAVGPEILGFRELVELVRTAIGSRALLPTVPPALLLLASRLLGLLVHDVVLTPDEVQGLRLGLLVSRDRPTGETRFTEWLARNAGELGVEWASELGRHFT